MGNVMNELPEEHKPNLEPDARGLENGHCRRG